MAKYDPAYAPAVLRERLEVMYMATAGSDTPYGALRWAGRELGVSASTLGRWLTVEHDEDHDWPSRRSRRTVELLETVTRLTYGQAALTRAAQQRQNHLRQVVA